MLTVEGRWGEKTALDLDLVCSPDVRSALRELALEAGHSFVLLDSGGRVLFETPRDSAAASVGQKLELPSGTVEILTPSGDSMRLGLVPSEAGIPASTLDAWLRSGACLVRNAIRVGSEVESMASEIVRSYEELSLLHSSSLELSRSEDISTAGRKALQLAMRHLRAVSAALYLRREEDAPYRLTATEGALISWTKEIRDEEQAPGLFPVFSGQSLLREHASVEDLEQAGVLCAPPGSLLCAPLPADSTGDVSILGWIAFYGREQGGAFVASDVKVANALAAQAAVSIANARLLEDRQALLMGTIRSLASAVDAKDRYTHGHSLRVTEYVLSIARQLGFSPSDLRALELAALLHDVGKIGVPDRVLSKPGSLDEEEWRHMRRHPVIGAAIVANVPGLPPAVQEGVRSHHERMDGRGYPDGLKGEDIPATGRIIAVADCFDAMTSDRPYRAGMPASAAIAQMASVSGWQFDPEFLNAFIKVWEAGEVQLTAAG